MVKNCSKSARIFSQLRNPSAAPVSVPSAVSPGHLVLFDGYERVVHGLVAECVDGRDEEVERVQQGAPVLVQRPLRGGVVDELVLQLGAVLSKLGELLTQLKLRRTGTDSQRTASLRTLFHGLPLQPLSESGD